MSRGHFVGVDYHRRLLSDSVRNEAFAAAIAAQVRDGQVVCDLGTGTGILALLAARAGARRVYAIEPAPIVRVAERIAAQNGLGDRIVFIEADARAVQLPEPVDVLISECLGNFFVTDEMQPVLRDAARFVKPGGLTIPHAVRLQLAPAWLPMFSGIRFFAEPCLGFDLSAALEFAYQRTYVLQVEPELLLGPAACIAHFDLLQAPDAITADFDLPISRKASLDGLAGWFEADLGAGVVLSTAPGQYTHWAQMVFPLESLAVQPGDHLVGQLALSLDSQTYRSRFVWQGRLLRAGECVARFAQDTERRFGALPTAGGPGDASRR